MGAISLKPRGASSKGIPLRKLAGAVGLGLLLVPIGGGGTPPEANTIGLINYPVPAGMNRSAASLRTVSGDFVAPLWNNRMEAGGSNAIGHIDGRDYKLSALNAGNYVVDISFHAIVPKYQGGIGNNSFVDLDTMDAMHRGYQFMRSGEEIGEYVYANQHYVEGPSALIKFLKTAPQKPIQVFGQLGLNSGCTLEFMCSDSTKLYYAVYDRLGSNVVTYVMAITHANDQFVTFSAGGSYKANHGVRTDSTLGLLTTNDANNIITGLAVQQAGTNLVKTHDLSNTLYVHDKGTGALRQTITSIQRPRACKVDSQDRLWMISATNTVSCYTIGSNGSLTPAGISLSGLVAPANIAIKGGIIYVTDHGSSQQIKAYNESGSLLWTLGAAGGQMATPDVSATRFYFSDAPLSVDWSSVVPYSNGQFLVIEPGNNRAQLFNADRTPVGGKAGVITYRTVGYECAIDMNDPTRLFWNYQEFKVDYTKSITDCWTLVRNWRASAPASHFITTNEQQNIELGGVFRKLYTDPMNGRTYATCQRPTDGMFVEVELASTGLRVVRTDTAPFALYKDGATCFSRFNSSNGYEWNEKARTGFDSSGNRIMAASTNVITLTSTADTDPFDWSGYPNADADLRTSDGSRYIYQTNLVRKLAGKTYGLGWHLGEARPGVNKFTKLLNPSTGDQEYAGGQPLDGYYDTGDHLYENDARPDLTPGPQAGYGGAGIRTVGLWIFEKVFGEFYRNGQQNESFMRHAPTGHMVLHYGVNSDEVRAWQAATGRRIYPGMSGGVQRHEVCFHPTNGDIIYEWHGEEGGSGMLNRWEMSGVSTFTVKSLPVFTVNSSTKFAKRWGDTAIDLLAKVPKRGSITSTTGSGWKQSRTDDYTNKFGGGPYWAARFGIKTYELTKSNGIYFRFRGTNTSITWASDAFANGSNRNSWTLRLSQHYEDGNPNDNEMGAANSGGLYCHLKDSAGKILVRSYIKNTGNNTAAVIANGKTLASGSTSELTDLWRKLRTYQDTIIDNSAGVVTAKFSTFDAVTLDGPFEAGGNFASDSFSLEYVAWDNGNSRDRVVALGSAFFIPALISPGQSIYAQSVTRTYPPASSYTYETSPLVVRTSVPAFNTGASSYMVQGRYFNTPGPEGWLVDLYMPAGEMILFDRCVFATSTNGDMLHITNDSRVRFRNCIFLGTGSQAPGVLRGRAIFAETARLIDAQNCYFGNTAGCKLNNWSTNVTSDNDTVTWKYNRYDNIMGGDGQGGGPYCQALQLQHVIRPGIDIGYNQVRNAPGASRVEDNYNFGESGGTAASPLRFHHNFIDGAYPANPTDGGFTGTGWTTDASSASVPASLQPQYIIAEYNYVIRCMNACANIAAGHHISYRYNTMVVSGRGPNGEVFNGVNNAVAIFKGQPYDDSQFDYNEIVNNTIIVNQANGENPYYVTGANTNIGPNSKRLTAGNTLNSYKLDAVYADEVAVVKTWTDYVTDQKFQVGVQA